MPSLSALATTLLLAATPTPTPTPTGIDEDLVTPGPIGFFVTAAIVVVVVLLIIDMVRRMRRVRYREEARDAIAAELAAGAPESDEPVSGR